ncbi:MAG: FAD-dependent oxidoreductase [Fidelibacterota bacterium]
MSNHVIIIGGGIGGSAAALRAAQNGLNTVWILGTKTTKKRSRSQWVANIDNMIGFHEDVVKNQAIKTLERRGFSEAATLLKHTHYHINNRQIIANTIERIRSGYSNCTLIEDVVTRLENTSDGFEATLSGTTVSAPAVVLATGVMDEQPRLAMTNKQGEVESSPKWIYPFANREQLLYCIRCEGHLTVEDRVAVLGHSPAAGELALMLIERYRNRVAILTNGQTPEISERTLVLLENYGIPIITDTITGFMNGGTRDLHGFEFTSREAVPVRFALVALGLHRVYNDLAVQVGARLMDEDRPMEKRHIWINAKGETSVNNLFVVGDAAKRDDEPVMKQIYTAQEYAVRAIDTIDSRRRKQQRVKILSRD